MKVDRNLSPVSEHENSLSSLKLKSSKSSEADDTHNQNLTNNQVKQFQAQTKQNLALESLKNISNYSMKLSGDLDLFVLKDEN